NYGEQARHGAAIGGHADFIDDEGHDQRIDVIEQIEQDAAALRSAAGGNLANDAVLRAAREFLDAARKEDLNGLRVELAEEAGHFDGFRDGAAPHRAPEVLKALFAEVVGQVGDVLHIVAKAATIEARGKLLHRRMRKHFQYVCQAGCGLAGAQRFLDKFRNALLNAHLRSESPGNTRTLGFDAGDEVQRLLHRGEAALGSGFLAEPDECGADQALNLLILLDAEAQAKVAHGFAKELGIGLGIQLGQFGEANRGLLARVNFLAFGASGVILKNADGFGALAAFGDSGPELAIENFAMRFHKHPGFGHLVFVRAENLAQIFDFAVHAIEHLADGIDFDFAALEAIDSEFDGEMLG